MQRLARAAFCLSITFIGVAAHSASHDPDPQTLMASGNESFRRGDYSTAVELYEAARDRGSDSALLSFNLGVAYYKLGEYQKASGAFESASADPDLATLSYLNLALNARKAGDRGQAEVWLDRARDTAESETVLRHVTRLRALIEEEQSLADGSASPTIRTGAARREPDFAWFLSAMTAFDSNAYRSPDGPYNDLSDPGAPLVTPKTQSGFYIPVAMRVEYAYPVGESSNVEGAYQYRGEHYLESDLANAEESAHRFSLGYEKLLGDLLDNRRRAGVAAVFRIQEETDFDRDDGLERDANGANVSNRFDYESTGVEGTLQDRRGRLGYGADFRFERRDYESVPLIFSYDHDLLSLGGFVNYRFIPRSRTEFGYTYYLRDYDERRSRDALGDGLTANPPLEYAYHRIELSHLQRFTDALLAEFSYSYMKRDDAFVGYNDYDQHRIRAAGSYRFSPKWRSLVRISWRDLDYPNAFAFNEPTAGPKRYDEFELDLLGEYSLTEQISVWARFRFEDVGSTDRRGAYDRTRTSIGFTWESR